MFFSFLYIEKFLSRIYVVSVVSRGRALHAQAQTSHSPIDRQLDTQLAWVVDMDRVLDSIENDAHRLGPNPPRDSSALRNTLQRLKVGDYHFIICF